MEGSTSGMQGCRPAARVAARQLASARLPRSLTRKHPGRTTSFASTGSKNVTSRPPASDAFEAGLRLAETFERHGVSYCLGGALALGQYSIPRATNDVDVNVFLSPPKLAPVFAALRDLGIDVNDGQAIAEADAK